MKLSFEKPEPFIYTGANWQILEYLVERFNRPGLDGSIVLRRTLILRELQLCLAGECGGVALSVLSESFDDELITEHQNQAALISLVSRFLLKVKYLHEKPRPNSSAATSDRAPDSLR